MTHRLTTLGALLSLVVSLLVLTPTTPSQAEPSAAAAPMATGFHISGRNLLDANGNAFVMRGTSHPHVWYQGEADSYAEIAGLGANTVRVVLGSGQRWGPSPASDVANVISTCKANKLVCVLEVHDTTGYGEDAAAATLDQAVTYWNSIRDVLIGQEAYVLINIGNEPIGNTNPGQWTAATTGAVQRMRTLGFTHTLVVDAPSWGQDWANIMRDNAPAVWAADSLRNTLFSVHMYQVYGTPASITGYFDAFAQMGLPLIVGEFGHEHQGQNVDEDTIMAEAQARGIGWMAWSYSGNSEPYLDQTVAFDPAQLTTWGQRVFTGANGVQATSKCATVFTGCGATGTAPSAPTAVTVTGTTSASVSLSWTGSASATQYQVQRAPGACATGSTFTQVGTSTASVFTSGGLAANTAYCFRVTASNASGTSAPSGTVTGTTSGTGTPGGCSAVATVQNQWGNGYVVQPVAVTNTGTAAVSGWRVTFTLPAGHTISGAWNATLSGTSGTITATNMGYNGGLAPGAGTAFGFQATRPNGNTQTPSGFTCSAP
ncbi:cellulase family glycosylhydrolase [Phytomonospora sp. NPDC050363]|uniref:cellulase family glycosylhydrolase n=1 Tax=Phytomonospora sp. NPDC050363 TaxID=3155642 RepID=UPI0033F1F835